MDMAAALWGGIAGSIAMLMVYGGFLGLRLTRLDLLRLEGNLLTAERSSMVYLYGLVLQLVLGALAGLAYRWVFLQLDSATFVGWGALIGVVHGALAALLLPVAVRGDRSLRDAALPPVGFAGTAYGLATPLALVAAHAVFGIWVGLMLLPAP